MSMKHNGSGIRVLEHSAPPSTRASDINDSRRDANKRSPLLSTSKSSAKFDKQVAVLPIRFQTMTRITTDTTESRSRLEVQSIDTTDNDEADPDRGSSDSPQRSAHKSSINGDQKYPKVGSGKAMYTEQPIGLVVALFHDGFVCRHINKENEGVDGFAQPYDAESSYFLACIDNGRVPEGLPDMIACAHYNGSVLSEIRDYREMRSALCPVSSAFLPAASALLQADTELNEDCHVWQTLLVPGKSPLPIHAQVSPLFEPPTLQSMFDHFPDVTPCELETLAMDAKRQLLQEEDVLLSSSSTESSSPRGDSQNFGFFPAEPQDAGNTNGDHSESTTTPTTRSRLHSRLETSPPASLLSPISRKSARSSLYGQEDYSTKRFKRQIQTKTKGAYQHKADRKPRQGLKVESSVEPDYSASQDEDMTICESSMSEKSQRGSRELLDDDTAPITPLPATQLFLSKLKGKRQRPDNELLYGKPVWVTIAHVGRFFRAATRLEREHSRFLHANARKLMQAEKTSFAETEHVAGSMRYLARQLGDLSRPSDVIAVACARELKAAEDEDRKLRMPDWMDTEEHSSSLARQLETSVALVSPDNEPALHLQHRDKDEDILLGNFFKLASDTANIIKDYEPTATAPHFNTFDDDGNLQLQSA